VLDDLLDPTLFKALCDATRARVVGCIAKCRRPCSVSEVAACCSIDLSVVSRHLQHLSRAGVLSVERRGRAVLYEVRYVELADTLRRLADAIDSCAPTRTAPRTRRGGESRKRF
jgi:ArsR family transcriptional regulator